MRILTLTDAITERMLAARRHSDAARGATWPRASLRDVRRRGDAALFSWTRRLDGARLTPKTLWMSATRAPARGSRKLSRELRAALGACRAQYSARGRDSSGRAPGASSWSRACASGSA